MALPTLEEMGFTLVEGIWTTPTIDHLTGRTISEVYNRLDMMADSLEATATSLQMQAKALRRMAALVGSPSATDPPAPCPPPVSPHTAFGLHE